MQGEILLFALIRVIRGQNFLSIHPFHHRLRIACARGGVFWKYLIDTGKFFLTQNDLCRFNILFEVLAALCSGDGHYILPLCQNPCKRELRCRDTLFAGDLFDLFDKFEILVKIFTLETRIATTRIIRAQIFEFPDLPGQKSPAQRRKCNEADPKLAHSCMRLRRISRKLYAAAAALFLVGVAFTFGI